MTAVDQVARQLHWQALTSPGSHAAAVTVPVGDRVRIVVWESFADPAAPDGVPPAALEHLLGGGSPAEIAAACCDDAASVCVAELFGDGRAAIAGYAAPSGLLVRPGSRSLVPTGSPHEPAVVRLDVGELLVLCSPSLLEEPPPGMVQPVAPPAGEDELWGWALTGLVRARSRGAVAVVQLRA